MKRISARHLLGFTTHQLWDMLIGEFVLVFDDGAELSVTARETLYSSYAWEFHRRFPKTPLLKDHHVRSVIGAGRLNADTHLTLLGRCMWAVYDTYVALPTVEDPVAIDTDPLSEMIYRLTNLMYNELSYRCEEYVVSLDVTDFIGVLDHPPIKEAKERFAEFIELPGVTYENIQKQIDITYKVVRDALEKDPGLDHNPLARGVRSKSAKMESVLQCVGPRGYLTDTDSFIFKEVPVTRGYAEGLRLFAHSLVESRSAAKSLLFSKAPLQQAEYFSRRLQLMSQIVQNLHAGDCGTREYLKWTVRGPVLQNGKLVHEGDMRQLVGKHYVEDGVLKTIRKGDRHLIGRTLNLRSVLHCAHPDPYGICATCFGELSLSVPKGTNIGHMCCTSMTQKSSQSVLSVKHMDGSSTVEGIVLEQDDQKWLKVGEDENSYLLSPALKGGRVTLVIPAARAQRLTDIREVKDVRELNITRVSELEEIGIRVQVGDTIRQAALFVYINHRLASITHALLEHIRDVGWDIDELGNYTIDMTGWDWEQPVLALPLKHFNMSDHSREIAELLESSVDEMQERDKNLKPDDVLVALYDLVNGKLSVNLAVLEVTLLGACIRSAEGFDYALPKPWTDSGLGVMSMSMTYRSLAPAMAYEGHREIITNPASYTNVNRPDHPFDALVMPQEVLSWLPPRVPQAALMGT